jgi:hypothetical protein
VPLPGVPANGMGVPAVPAMTLLQTMVDKGVASGLG